ncbi:MAG TPA: DUF2179 domain-containing protein [Anaerohalosphaeraceae bacterium]|nr:DUF2179 domain-containing protein [Anaerohalosphaeraceae bacterium]HOL31852.1 DUF2179 domain-containing protein [Anaerohalosphaeraceae bacterium]HOM75078.1 DUF2179 domain-containing protein [Anaerohalosphaeraceae bacterium]HPC63167.1 DUF2179 domain-containing protein [Anaerohalosphaeraceae bacterium]HPO68956.1 DUF2179 domain-containing protein [Anaerohalosphaeraceae bacterium]
MDISFVNSDIVTWIVIPVLIFLARIVDVTIGTARVIFVSRGYRLLAAAAGFVEVLIWLLAIGQIMKNLSNPICYIAYASGFAVGNYLGITLAERLSLGFVLIRVITNKNAAGLIESLKNSDCGVTSIQGSGVFGPVAIVFTIAPRHQIDQIIRIIHQFNPQAFYSVEEIGRVSASRPFKPSGPVLGRFVNIFRPFHKGK